MHIENIEIVDFTLAPFLLRARDTSGNLQEEIEEICINVRCILYFLEILCNSFKPQIVANQHTKFEGASTKQFKWFYNFLTWLNVVRFL